MKKEEINNRIQNEINNYKIFFEEQGLSPDEILEKIIEVKKELNLELKENKEAEDKNKKEKNKVVQVGDSNVEKLWLYLADKYSAFNHTPAKYTFWVLMATLLKKTYIKIHKSNGKEIKIRLPFFFIQSSRSGKDELISFLITVIDEINKQYLKSHKQVLIKHRKVDGSDSVETMLNHFKTKKQGKQAMIDNSSEGFVKGIFEEYDLLYSPECSFMLIENRKFHKNTFGENLLQAIEGTKMVKKLVSWNGVETVTMPNFCFVGATRPVVEHQKSIIESGLQQRGLSYIRKLTTEDREKMVDIFTKYSLEEFQEIEKNRVLIQQLAKSIIDIFLNIKNNGMTTTQDSVERKRISYMLRDYIKEKLRFCADNYPKEEHVNIGQTFAMGLERTVLLLAYKNAMIDNVNVVKVEHFKMALLDIDAQMENIMNWVEDIVEENNKSKNTEKRVFNAVRMLLKDDGQMKTIELTEAVSKKCEISKFRARDIIYNLCKKEKLNNEIRGSITL